MSEPTPSREPAHVPDAVLDELRSAFEGIGLAGEDPGVIASIAQPAIDRLGDDATGPWSPVPPAGGLPTLGLTGDVVLKPIRREEHVVPPRDPGPSAIIELDDEPAPPPPRATIVIGDDDELPDPFDLDDDGVVVRADRGGELGESRLGGTVVIGDELDSSGIFDAVEPPARSMDPRVRARRIAVKRAAGRKKLIWIGAIALVVLVVVGTLALLASSLFAVSHIDVTGDTYTDHTRLQAIQQEMMGTPILLLDSRAYERKIAEIPWVERVIITTDFPHRVSIDIRERIPLATFQGSDTRFRVIDREGRVLDVIQNQPVAYALISGRGPDADAGDSAGAVFAHAAQIGSALPAEVRAQLQSVTADAGNGDLGLVLTPAVVGKSPITVRLGGFSDVDAKLARLVQLMHQKGGLTGIVKVDVSTDETSTTPG